MKLTKEEIYSLIKKILDEEIDLQDKLNLNSVIWKLQHKLKHLEDKE